MPHAVKMRDVLRQALAPVLRDIRVSGGPLPEIRDDDWAGGPDVASAMLQSRCDGSGAGVSVDATEPEPERVARVADQVQEWVIEELWGQAATNWPVCPHHPTTHPLRGEVRDGIAAWACPSDGTPFSPVGALS